MPDFDRITQLTVKFVQGSISPAEQAELDLWLNASPENRGRFEQRISEKHLLQGLAMLKEGEEAMEADRSRIIYGAGKVSKLPGVRWKMYTAAAAVLLLIATGVVFLLHGNKEPGQPRMVSAPAHDLAPGGNKAILTLADNRQIVLDSAAIGRIATQGGSQVQKQDTGLLAYTEQNGGNLPVTFNTISTPPGGQYTVLLADGTRIWLDAASELRFPTAFPGSERTVELLAGQAYLEVAKNALKPFRVKVGGMAVSVLGTHFNIKAYAGEPVQTTLLEGSVRVGTKDRQVLLRPGEQAQLTGAGLQMMGQVDMDEVVAWKNGYFQFTDATLETVMSAISRWYGVEVKYEGDKAAHRLSAVIRRDTYASDVLEALSQSGYHFKITGKTITVLP